MGLHQIIQSLVSEISNVKKKAQLFWGRGLKLNAPALTDFPCSLDLKGTPLLRGDLHNFKLHITFIGNPAPNRHLLHQLSRRLLYLFLTGFFAERGCHLDQTARATQRIVIPTTTITNPISTNRSIAFRIPIRSYLSVIPMHMLVRILHAKLRVDQSVIEALVLEVLVVLWMRLEKDALMQTLIKHQDRRRYRTQGLHAVRFQVVFFRSGEDVLSGQARTVPRAMRLHLMSVGPTRTAYQHQHVAQLRIHCYAPSLK